MKKPNYSKLEIFKRTTNTSKVKYPKDKEPIKCGDCQKILISHQITDLNWFWVGELKCKECDDGKAKNQHLCSNCYLAKLEAGDPIITKDFNTYHNF